MRVECCAVQPKWLLYSASLAFAELYLELRAKVSRINKRKCKSNAVWDKDSSFSSRLSNRILVVPLFKLQDNYWFQSRFLSLRPNSVGAVLFRTEFRKVFVYSGSIACHSELNFIFKLFCFAIGQVSRVLLQIPKNATLCDANQITIILIRLKKSTSAVQTVKLMDFLPLFNKPQEYASLEINCECDFYLQSLQTIKVNLIEINFHADNT